MSHVGNADSRMTLDVHAQLERAVRDLVCAGLLHEREGTVVPTRAAVRFGALAGI